jgi:hypothetical protein
MSLNRAPSDEVVEAKEDCYYCVCSPRVEEYEVTCLHRVGQTDTFDSANCFSNRFLLKAPRPCD